MPAVPIPSAPPRSDRDIIKASRPFEQEQRWRSWVHLLTTLVAIGVLVVAVTAAPWWPVALLAGIVLGLVQMRLFVIYHDMAHGAIFRRDPIARGLLAAVGFCQLAPPAVWRETHDFHHQHNAQLPSLAIGSYPLLTTGMLARTSDRQWRRYRTMRHPLTMACGMLTVFIGGMIVAAAVRDPRRHWLGLLGVLVYAGAVVAVWLTAGWAIAVGTLLVPYAVAMALGSYLFYAQHNCPGMQVRRREDWSHVDAARFATSHFEMGPLMRWFTANIGLHQVHHLNHRIPFYRLGEALRAIPELHDAVRTSWRLRDIRACLRLAVWDPVAGRMLDYAEAEAVRRRALAA